MDRRTTSVIGDSTGASGVSKIKHELRQRLKGNDDLPGRR